jgi:hypothetical protein
LAKEKKPKRITHNSPKGVFSWPKLNEVDYGTEKYPVKDGQYVVNLVVPAADKATKAFIKLLEPLWREALEEGKQKFGELSVAQRKKLKAVTENPFFTEEFDQETEEPTGNIIFKFKMAASGKYREGRKAGQTWTAKPNVFDASGELLKKLPSIWSGTVGKVAFYTRPYFIDGSGAAGLTLALSAVQIIDLVSEGERSAGSYGFGKEEGYKAEDNEDDETSDEDENDDDTSDEGGDADSSDGDDADF